MAVRRMLPFVLLNIIVSTVVVLALLFWWDSRQPEDEAASGSGVGADVETTTNRLPNVIPTPRAGGVGAADQADAAEEDEPFVYTVQPGDTLGSISTQFEVTLEDIMLVNGLTNPNFLQVNQELIIPVGGIPTATPPPSPTATAAVAPTPIATEPPAEGEAIVEVAEVIGLGSLADEAVSIVNIGSRPIALAGWQLLDEEGLTYIFDQVTLFGDGAAILVHTETGQDGPSDLFWGLEQPVWEPGETVILVDVEGTVRATFVIPQ